MHPHGVLSEGMACAIEVFCDAQCTCILNDENGVVMREREGKTKRRTTGGEMETERTTPLHVEDGLKEK